LGYQFTDNFSAYFTGTQHHPRGDLPDHSTNNVYSDGAPTLEQIAYGGARWQIGATWQN
jgi:hypothetical protein